MDGGPYDDVDEAVEQEILVLRFLQSLPPGSTATHEEMRALNEWAEGFQRQRAMVGLLVRGMARLKVVDGAPAIQANLGRPLPSLEDLDQRGDLPPGWRQQARALPDR